MPDMIQRMTNVDDFLREQQALQIHARVAEGETLRQIAKSLGVAVSTVLRMATFSPAMAEQYARARDAVTESHEAELLEAARGQGEYAKMDPQSRRLLVDTLKWDLAHRRPKVYGDRVEQVHSGAVATLAPADVTPEVRDLILRHVMKDI